MANSKSQLNLYCQGLHLDLPVYSTEPMRNGFSSSVNVCQQDFTGAVRSTKKLAEEDAARVAMSSLRQNKTSLREDSVGGSQFYPRSAFQQSKQNNEFAEYHITSKLSASKSRPGTTGKRVSSTRSTDYALKLEKLCQSQGLPPPQYDEETAGEKVIATVSVEGSGDFSSGEWETYDKAKEYAALIALAELGIKLLNINRAEEEDTERDELISRSTGSRADTRSPPVGLPPGNYKAMLNEYCQKHYLPLPLYETEYPEDSTGYIAVVKVCGKEYYSTVEMAKKLAEQKAAGKAALDLGLVKGDTVEKRPLGTQERVTENSLQNFKGTLQEYLQKRGLSTPQYSTETNYEGQFVSTVTLVDSSRKTASLQGNPYSNKKSAEQDAARKACEHYKLL